MMDDAEAKKTISVDGVIIGLQQFEELHTSVNHKTMPEAEEVVITTMINQCTNTEKLAEELHQQGDETKITALHAELANVVFESSAKTILEHDETDLTQETTASVDLLTDNRMQLLDELHHQDDGNKISVTSTEHMDVVEAKDIISREEANYGLQQVEELHGIHGLSSQADVTEEITFVNDKTMCDAEDVENATMINQGTNTLQLVEELDQQGDETKLTVMRAELINKVSESSGKTILVHGEAEITKETTLVDAKTVFRDEEVETKISIDLVTDNSLQLLDELHQQNDESGISVPSTKLSNKVSASYAEMLSQHGETENRTTSYQATNPGKLAEDLPRQGNEFELTISSIDVSQKLSVEEVKLLANDEHKDTILIDHVNDPQIVEELRQDSDIRLSDESVIATVKPRLNNDGIENPTSIDLVTNNSLQLFDELHQQDDESGISVPSTKLSNKVNSSYAETLSQHGEMENCTSSYQAIYPGKLAEDLPRQGSESELSITSIDVSQKLSVEKVKLLPNGEHENIIFMDHVNDPQIVEELPQDSDIRVSDESVIATVKPRRNNDGIENPISTGKATNEPESETVSNIELLVEEKVTKESHTDSVVWDDQKHEKTKLNEKKIKIAEELKSLNPEMDKKLKKIEELAEHVLAIDAEISQMEFKCRESKGRHANFINLYKFMTESQLPLRSHSEIRLLMKKMDKKAQQRLANALDLQFNIEVRAKLKLSLQEERNKLGKLVEDQKLEMQQKLNETVSVIELEEAADPDMVSQCIETATNCIRKRKADDRVEELCATLQAKRMAFDVVTNP